jgi:hypothetical protein
VTALERDLQLDEPRPESLQLGAVFGAQLVPGASEVAEPVLQEPGTFAGEALGFIGIGEGPNGLIEILAEGERHPPLVQPLLGLGAGVAHIGVDVNLADETRAPVGGPSLGGRILEGLERRGEGWSRCARDRTSDMLIGPGEA